MLIRSDTEQATQEKSGTAAPSTIPRLMITNSPVKNQQLFVTCLSSPDTCHWLDLKPARDK
jgi:hypothetical protein